MSRQETLYTKTLQSQETEISSFPLAAVNFYTQWDKTHERKT